MSIALPTPYEALGGANESLFECLSGWFGGPGLYTEKKCHPRLCMRTALTEQVSDRPLREGLLQAFTQMADHMVNTGDRAGCGQGHAEQGGQACAA